MRQAVERRAVAGAEHALRRWGSATPSFSYKLHEARRAKRAQPGLSSVSMGKLELKDWAASLGVRTPAALQIADRVEELDFERLPETFVVKPVSGASSRGVFLIERQDGELHSLADEAVVTVQDIARAVHTAARSFPGHSTAVLVEERIDRSTDPGKAPFDWKVYAFHGRVGLITQRDPAQRPARLKYYDREGNELGRIRYDRPFDRSLRPPRHPRELRRVAELVSANVGLPFLRVDMYEDDPGVVLGEITWNPGGTQRYRPAIDRMLGELWEEAELRLCGRQET